LTERATEKPKARTAPALLDEIAARDPGRIAVIDGERRWSYAELRDETRTVAAGLWALGVRPGDRVAILMGNRAEWLSSYFAILALGATAVALNTWLTPPEQAYQLEHAEVSTLIAAARFRERDFITDLAGMRAQGLPALQRLIVLEGEPPESAVPFSHLARLAAGVDEATRARIWSTARPTDTACILYTSGSTARPKGVPLQHWGLIDNMWEIGERMRLTPDDRFWFGISLFWSFGCVNALFAVMSHGGSFVLQHHFDAGEALRLIERDRCSVIYGTPNMAQAMLEHPEFGRRDLSSLRTGAAIGSPEQIEMFVNLGASEICNVYGLTEAYGNSCVADCKAPLAQRLHGCGAPLPGVELRLIDLDSGAPLPAGTVGEIALRGRNTPGYLNDEAATAASFSDDGFLLTGDLGLLDEHGWLYFRGRRKELIKSGGINISPAEIEEVLSAHDLVVSAFVTGLPDPRLDQAVAAVIVPDGDLPASKEAAARTLREHCREVLAAYKVPRRFVFVDAAKLPATSTGKLQRNRLNELFGDPGDQ
jgi:fatty-acyl-CoA synthase